MSSSVDAFSFTFESLALKSRADGAMPNSIDAFGVTFESIALKAAPEAQYRLAPRFSVGLTNTPRESRSPVGTAQSHFQ